MGLNGYRAELLSIRHDPRDAGDEATVHHPDGLLVVEDGLIVAAGAFEVTAPRFPGLAVQHFPGRIIIPGFVDTHIHYPQIDHIASYGHQLLDWLEQHI